MAANRQRSCRWWAIVLKGGWVEIRSGPTPPRQVTSEAKWSSDVQTVAGKRRYAWEPPTKPYKRRRSMAIVVKAWNGGKFHKCVTPADFYRTTRQLATCGDLWELTADEAGAMLAANAASNPQGGQ